MAKVSKVFAREILDSRGNPTVEATVLLDDGTQATAACPSGASTGTHEAVELRDKDPQRYQGKGVKTVVDNILKRIYPHVAGVDAANQQEIDKRMIELDATENKSALGANAILSVSMAVAKAAAASAKIPVYRHIQNLIQKDKETLKIPTPLFNIINGGLHAGGNLDIQEFIVIPATSKPFNEGLQLGVLVYHTLKKLLEENNLSTLIGDEGGFAPTLNTNEEALELIAKTIETAKLRLGYDIFTGLDAASSSFYEDGSYHLKGKNTGLSAAELGKFYNELISKYHILYLEDPFSEDDFDGWAQFYATTNHENTIITGDDLTVTNPVRLQMALDKKTISGILIKLNQIGSVTETMAVVEMARAAGLKIIVSHRSGETNDDFVADFGVGVMADYVKFGAPARGERVAKYNRLLQIEQELKDQDPENTRLV